MPRRPRRKTERTAHRRPYCYTCSNTGIVTFKVVNPDPNGAPWGMAKCTECPKAYPTSGDPVAPQPPPPIDFQRRAAGEKED